MSLALLDDFKNHFYRLTGTSAQDDALSEHDGSESVLTELINRGASEAQTYMIEIGYDSFWLQSASVGTRSGADSTDGGTYIDLATDFYRLAGDDKDSPLRQPDGTRWGNQVDVRQRFRVTGNRWWVQGKESGVGEQWQLWFAHSASVPSDLEYWYYPLVTVDDSTTVRFPTADRPLITSFAAQEAISESWFPMDSEAIGRLNRYHQRRMAAAWMRRRKSKTPRKSRPGNMIGSHYWASGG